MGRGTLYSLISRVFFVVGSFAVHWVFSRILNKSEYGIFGVCMSILTISYIFLNNGVRQTVSKRIAEDKSMSLDILKKSIAIQLVIATIVSLVITILGIFAESIFNDTQMKIPLFICAVIVILQGLIFVSVGAFNGLKDFKTENVLSSIYALLRTVIPISFILIFKSLSWGMFGFIISGLLTFLFCVLNYKLLPRINKHKESAIVLFKNSIYNIVIFGVITLLMNLDLVLLKVMEVDSDLVGVYTAASTLSKPPYWILASIGSTVLPFLSTGEITLDFKRKFSNLVIQFIVLLFPGILLVAGFSLYWITFIYGTDYLEGAIPLSFLVFAILFQGGINILANMFIGLGRAANMMFISVLGALVNIVSLFLLIPKFGLVGASMGTLVSSLTIFVATFVYLRIYTDLSLFEIDKSTVKNLIIGTLILIAVIIWGKALQVNPLLSCIIGYTISLLYYLKTNLFNINNLFSIIRK